LPHKGICVFVLEVKFLFLKIGGHNFTFSEDSEYYSHGLQEFIFLMKRYQSSFSIYPDHFCNTAFDNKMTERADANPCPPQPPTHHFRITCFVLVFPCLGIYEDFLFSGEFSNFPT
jgi:hypothetical protein